MGKLSRDVELELQRQMDDLDAKAQQANDAIGKLSPQIEHIQRGLAGIQKYLSQSMSGAIDRSTEAINGGLQNAEALQQLLAALVKMAAESHSEVAFAHQQSVELVTRKTKNEVEVLMTAMASAMASSAALQNQIVSHLVSCQKCPFADSNQEMSRIQAVDLAERQMVLEEVGDSFMPNRLQYLVFRLLIIVFLYRA